MNHHFPMLRIVIASIVLIFIFGAETNIVEAQYDPDDIFQYIENPYEDFNPDSKTLYLTTGSVDDYLDPAMAYDESTINIIGCTYEPPLTYHFLKRPYKLVPLTARKLPQPLYFREVEKEDSTTIFEECTIEELYIAMNVNKQSNNNVSPKKDSEDAEAKGLKNLTGKVRVTYRIEITPGIYYAPHPCFAKDSKGYLYHMGKGKGRSIDEELGYSLTNLDDFRYFSSRELVAKDYVYGIRRLFSPQQNCPILNALLLKYIEEAGEFTGKLRKALNIVTNEDESDDGFGIGGDYYGNSGTLLPYCDYKFEGVKEVDKYTFEINLHKPYENFKYWLATYFFSPIPWEADVLYNEIQINDYKHFGFDSHPVGTGPYTVRFLGRYINYWGMDKYRGDYPIENSRSFVKSEVNPYFNRLAHGTGEKPPVYDIKTGFGVDKNDNGVVDDDELPFYDENKNGKYEGMEKGEGFYFEDLNLNRIKDENEKWFALPASYRNTFPEEGMLNTTKADLQNLIQIRKAQKKYLNRNKLTAFSQMQEKAEVELEKIKKNGIDILKIGDHALGNLVDAGRRLPLIERIIRTNTQANVYTLSFLANGYLDMYEPRSETQSFMMTNFSNKQYLKKRWAETGLILLPDQLLTISYWGINMLDKEFGWNNIDSPKASDSKRKIRQALAIAFNVEDWVQKFGYGMSVAKSFAPPGLFTEEQQMLFKPNSWVYRKEENGEYKRRSIEEAKALLKEAGWENGKNSYGEQLIIEVDADRFIDRQDEKEWFVNQFAKIGVKVDAERSVTGLDIAEGKYQLFYTGWNADYPDPENFALLFYGPNHESVVGTTWGGMNKANYMNKSYDFLYENLAKVQSPEEKMKILQNMIELINFDAPVLGFMNSVRNIMMYPWLMNYKTYVISGRQFAFYRIDTERRKKTQAAIAKLYE